MCFPLEYDMFGQLQATIPSNQFKYLGTGEPRNDGHDKVVVHMKRRHGHPHNLFGHGQGGRRHSQIGKGPSQAQQQTNQYQTPLSTGNTVCAPLGNFKHSVIEGEAEQRAP